MDTDENMSYDHEELTSAMLHGSPIITSISPPVTTPITKLQSRIPPPITTPITKLQSRIPPPVTTPITKLQSRIPPPIITPITKLQSRIPPPITSPVVKSQSIIQRSTPSNIEKHRRHTGGVAKSKTSTGSVTPIRFLVTKSGAVLNQRNK